MGNHASRRTSATTSSCKVVLPDGTVTSSDRGTPVAELMLEHPQQFAIELSSLLSGAKPVPLPADHRLVPGKVYLMLPMRPGKPPVLSAAEARRVLSRARSVLRSGSFPSSCSRSSSLVNWAMPEPGGSGGGGGLGAEQGKAVGEFSSLALGEVPEFVSRQLSGRLWKPSLHTIEERAPRTKVPHWLF
uniref:Glycine--tRNA ligase alpha subunit n=1 Tax=Anthurium amnicola TaxID=1678845 RepID=A0A1D1XCT1_9ARAE